jgi:hypothetical protein
MALVSALSALSFSSDADTATITDAVVYGGANPLRAAVAVFIEGWKMDADSESTAITITNTAPDSATTWTFESDEDGWYKVRQYIIPNWNILTAYTTGQVVYYTNGNVYRAIASSTGNLPTNTTYFTEVEFNDATVDDANNVITGYKDYLVIEHGKKCAGEAVAAWSKDEDCGSCKKVELMASWLQKDALVYAAERFAAISLFNKAEAIARKLETYCESC